MPAKAALIHRQAGLVLGAALALAGCTTAALPPPSLPPEPVPLPVPPRESAESAALRAYYAQVQTALLGQGLLRTDGGGPDTPWDARRLAETFLTVALNEEFDASGGRVSRATTPSRLTRWAVPVRVGLSFGASVPPDRRAADTQHVASYLARLSREMGHPIALSDRDPNFRVYLGNVEERRGLGPALLSAMPDLSPAQVSGVTAMDRSTYCLVWTQSDGATSTLEQAFVVIPSEHPDLLRLACLHEEIAQGLGLPNDSPRARPSIFNDDQEFAFLTTLDAAMLRLLYSPALTPGLTEAEARTLVFELASRLTGGET